MTRGRGFRAGHRGGRARVAAIVLLVVAAGCFTRNAGEPRFFRPASVLLDDATEPAPASSHSPVAIRIRAVEAGPFLRERIVWRTSPVEYGLYEQRRWREAPTSYVERALRAALRRDARVRVSDDPRVPALHVDVIAFDEVLAPQHAAVVEASASLRDGKGQLMLDRPFAAEEAITGDDPALLARAMGSALDTVASRIADAVGDATAAGAQRQAPAHSGRNARTRRSPAR